MSEASEKMALFLATEMTELAKSLVEMAAFEQAVGSPTVHYTFPLQPGEREWADRKGLIRMKGTAVRLTRWGREVVNSLDELEVK